MPTELKLSFPATTSGMIAALEAIEHTGTAWTLEHDLLSRVRIVVEELFSNTIKYGYGEECDRPVRIHAHVGPPFSLTYEDEAAPFDPTRWKRPQDAEFAADDRQVGQDGIALVMGLSTTVHYAPKQPGNRLELAFGPKTPAS
jgi:serine/threonine-protein kinase RsbW